MLISLESTEHFVNRAQKTVTEFNWKICLGFNFAHESTTSAETTCFLSVIVDAKMI